MRILYGVCSDGLGHAMRACVLSEALASRGHELLFAAFGRPAALLRARGHDVLEVRGLTCAFEGSAIRRGQTVWRALSGTPERVRHNARAALHAVKAFAPELTLTDFSGFACYAKLLTGTRVISIDHQHVIDRFRHPREITRGIRGDFELARATVRAKTPGCDRFLVTSFYFPELRPRAAGSTSLTGPLLRSEVLRLRPTRGEHVVVYQTAPGCTELLECLAAVRDVPFRVYGAGAPQKLRNVELLAFDPARFLEDLASSRALVANGGFSALSEAVYLGKPVLSVPVAHQGEQELNAAWLEYLGLGLRGRRATPELLRRLLAERAEAPPRDARLDTGTRDFTSQLLQSMEEAA
jgi:uncharacterized protein (TIGR00661 family)